MLMDMIRFGFDNYERTQQRRAAALILDNHELIMMHALARRDVRIPFPRFSPILHYIHSSHVLLRGLAYLMQVSAMYY